MEDDHHIELGSGMEVLEMVNSLRASLFEDSQAEAEEDCCDNERLRSLIQSLEAEINNNPCALLQGEELAGSSSMEVGDQSHDDDHETCTCVGSLMWGQDCWIPLDHNDIVDDHDLVASSPNDDEMNNWWVEPSGDGIMHDIMSHQVLGVALRGSNLWEETLYDLEI